MAHMFVKTLHYLLDYFLPKCPRPNKTSIPRLRLYCRNEQHKAQQKRKMGILR
jgi:hypothetical protein